MFQHHTRKRHLSLTASLLLASVGTQAQTTGSIHGTVRDPLGAAVPNATVDLLQGTRVLTSAQADPQGHYSLPLAASGSYQLRANAPSFQPALSPVRFFGHSDANLADLLVATPTDTQQITVSATGTPTPLAQVAASLTILTADQFPYVRDIQEPLRYVPGVQITQTGQAGGTSGMYIRGGNTNANKVLIDGIPADDLGGAVEFANIAAAGIAQVEVLREPNSALYGSDALAGVVSMTTRRGTTPLPQLDYAIDGGNFHTWSQQAALSGASHHVDYFTSFARQDTGNSIASNPFHNVTFANSLGYQPNPVTDLRFTLRHTAAEGGKPNAIALYGIPNSAFSSEHDLYLGAVLDHRTTERWHNELRYGALRLNYLYNQPVPTGIPLVSKGVITAYLGAPVVIRGANGYTVAGQATLNFPGTYPSITTNHSQRDFMYAQTDYRLPPLLGHDSHTLLLAGFKYEDERGTSLSTGSPIGTADRGNYSTMLEIQGDALGRLFYTVGTGLEHNAVYGFAATPRASAAYYLVRPSSNSLFSGTKLHGSFSKGIKGPSIYIQNHSLFGLLTQSNNPALIQQYGITPAGAETARVFDGGLDQEIGHGRARIGATYFHNEFGNGLEFLSQTALGANFGVSTAALPNFTTGAYVNSLAYRAQGLETEIEVKLGNHLFARGGYTLLDAKVQRSFASSALKPTFNTAYNFSKIPIGSSGPLVNNRPFRRARNSGYFGLQYTRSRWNAQLNGTLVGLRDDSDFLSGSLLLPNQNLDGAYQRVELTGEYRVTHRVSTYVEIQNLLSEHYSEAFGYPALPLSLRSGVRITLGGESWKLN
jgi:iron complex outermembrane receptor protein/vitamin B12 transporter